MTLGAGSFSDPFSMDKTKCADTVPGNEGLATENTPPADLDGSVLAMLKNSIPKKSIDLQDIIKSWVDKDSDTKQVR